MDELSNSRILVVDDNETNVDILVAALSNDYKIGVALNGEEALRDVAENPPDLILLDIMMPGINGYEVCQRLKSNDLTRKIPIIFLTAMSDDQEEAKGLALGAVDYITKPFNLELVKARARGQLELKRHRDNLEDLVKARTIELELTQEVTFEAMGTLAEYRDPETGGHIKRTQKYVMLLVRRLKGYHKFNHHLDDDVIDIFYRSAPLHDIGKVGVPDNILLKPGKLTEDEFGEMTKHSIYGRDAIAVVSKRLGENSFLRFAKEIAESHHEKWDGSGYPSGIVGEEIPISGRIMALADVYDALISKRVYKPPYPHNKAVDIIIEGKGTHFDPVLVEVFVEIQERFRQIAIEHADHEEEIRVLTGGS